MPSEFGQYDGDIYSTIHIWINLNDHFNSLNMYSDQIDNNKILSNIP